MIHRLLFLFFSLFATLPGNGQRIISIDYDSNISLGLGQLLSATLGINLSLDNGTDLYRITYEATGSNMLPDTASGLIMIPDEINGPVPIAIYQHGTTDGRDDVPSNLAGGYQLGALLSGKGMVVLAPDFLGMGTSRGFHPYLHAETEATAAVDMLEAVLTYLTENDIEWNNQLFITGYSQGGHAAMALHQYLEEVIPGRFPVTASLPMSGPYNVSGAMRDIAFAEETYGFPAYLVYALRGLREVNPSLYQDESEVIKPEYLPVISNFLNTGLALFDMNEDLIQELLAQTGRVFPRDLFVDSVLNAYENDTSQIFTPALRESDVHDWAPEAPVLMLYCESDDQVPFENSLLADSLMNALGAVNTSSMDVSNGQNLDHTDCIVPALNEGLPWLLSFVSGTTSNEEIALGGDLEIFPNPVADRMQIRTERRITRIAVYSMTGARLQVIEGPSSSIDFDRYVPGMYVLNIYTDNELIVKRVIVQE